MGRWAGCVFKVKRGEALGGLDGSGGERGVVWIVCAGGWWLVAGGWWLVVGGWWLVVGSW